MVLSDRIYQRHLQSLSMAATLAVALLLGGAGSAPAQYDVAPGGGTGPDRLYVQAETTVDRMPPGMADAYVRGIQEELAVHGYKPGSADGIPGRRTRHAIRNYQRDAGLTMTGEPSKELLDHLKFALPKVYAGAWAAGPSRKLVTEIQQDLYARGYYASAIDGLVGPATRDAVRRFQTDAGLAATGQVDSRLRDELNLADSGIRAY